MMKKYLIIAVMLFCISMSGFANQYIFNNAGGDNLWSTPGNWLVAPGIPATTPPSNGDEVTIMPPLSVNIDQNVTIALLLIPGGATVEVLGTNTLTVTGNLVNGGVFSNNGGDLTIEGNLTNTNIMNNGIGTINIGGTWDNTGGGIFMGRGGNVVIAVDLLTEDIEPAKFNTGGGTLTVGGSISGTIDGVPPDVPLSNWSIIGIFLALGSLFLITKRS